MPLSNLNRQLYCPHCSEEFYPGECRIEATAAYKSGKIDISIGQVLQEPRKGLFARTSVTPLTGPLFTRTRAVRICPHCHRPLPTNFEQAENCTIAIIGDSNSGVSTSIGSLLYELKEGKLLRMYSDIRNAALEQETERRWYDYYFVPIFLNKQQLMANMPSFLPEPLIYRFSIQAPGGRKARQINLIFYDTAGEDICDQVQLVQFAHHLFHASGIIFLADPIAMPGIVSQLPSHFSYPRSLSSAQILNRVLSTLMQNNSTPGQKFPVPLAITLSKSDVLKYMPIPNYTFLVDVERNGPLEQRELQIASHEVQAVIRQFGDQNLLQIPQLCSNVEYFAIAATGCQVDNHGQYAFVKPTRCLDPLIWILGQLGVLEVA